jgi:hypothetical protein
MIQAVCTKPSLSPETVVRSFQLHFLPEINIFFKLSGSGMANSILHYKEKNLSGGSILYWRQKQRQGCISVQDNRSVN